MKLHMTVSLKQYAGGTPALYYCTVCWLCKPSKQNCPHQLLGSCKPKCKLLMLSSLQGWIWAINHTLWLALGDVEKCQYGCSRDKQKSLTGPCYWWALKSTMLLLEAPLQSMEQEGHGFSTTHKWLARSPGCMHRGETKGQRNGKNKCVLCWHLLVVPLWIWNLNAWFSASGAVWGAGGNLGGEIWWEKVSSESQVLMFI